MLEDWRPWAAGAAAGSCMTVIGHPFDTLKVRMQASSIQYGSTLQCARQMVATEGLLAMYKGLQPAILTSCITSGLRFGVQHHFNDWLVSALSSDSRRKQPGLLRRRSSAASPTISAYKSFDELSVGARVLAEGGGGAACGLVLPLIFTPLELIKVRRQVHLDGKSNWQIFVEVWRAEGIGGLYTGHRLTVARSTLGNMTLFGSFEAWKALLKAPSAPLRGEECPWLVSILSGVLSGWTTQLITFPIDAAKSRIQAATGAGSARSVGLIPALVSLWRDGAMYRGVSSMMARAVPVHLAYLPVYGLLMTALDSNA